LTSLRFRWPLLFGLMLLQACSSSPPRRIYVLEGQENPIASVTMDAGRPVVELKSVLMPDYLDTTDILLRDGQNELKISPTGRWGERLSVGVTRALGQALSKRVPGVVVLRSDTSRQPARTLLIDISTFDIWPDHRCVLTARWRILGEDGRSLGAGERATVITPVTPSSNGVEDVAVVQAMDGALGQLADHIAADLTRTLGPLNSRSRLSGR
jgi:cholesterol transport system auxiliary component